MAIKFAGPKSFKATFDGIRVDVLPGGEMRLLFTTGERDDYTITEHVAPGQSFSVNGLEITAEFTAAN